MAQYICSENYYIYYIDTLTISITYDS